MKNLATLLVAMTCCMAAVADNGTADALISRCEKLKRQADRDVCIKESLRISNAKPSPEKKVAPLPPTSAPEASFPHAPEEEWRRSINIKTSSFSKEITYSTNNTTEGSTYGSPEYTWTINAYVDKSTEKTSFMISFADIYTGSRWKFWQYADGDKAERLEVVSGSRKVSSCSRYTGCLYSESFGIILPKDFLVSAANEGRDIKLQSSNGDSFIFRLSSDQASNLLSAVAACKNTGCESSISSTPPTEKQLLHQAATPYRELWMDDTK